MKWSEFEKLYLIAGKGYDVDGKYGVQCVDLIKLATKHVYGFNCGAWGNAEAYYNCFSNRNWGGYVNFNKYFFKIPNDPLFTPMKYDIFVYGKNFSSKHNCGHIGICTGNNKGTTQFQCWEQNRTGNNDPIVKAYRNYKNDFLGVLRPLRTVREAVNIRTEPSKDAKLVGELQKGDKVSVYEIKNKWARIGTGQWISANYLETL